MDDELPLFSSKALVSTSMSNTWMGAGVDVHVHFCRLERSYDKLELDFDSLVDSMQFN
jgi:hypothetical protein